MTAKASAAKKPAQPRKPRKAKTDDKAAPVAEDLNGFENLTLMRAFHRGDAIARALYPAQAWNMAKEATGLRIALITAMNLYSSGYAHSQNVLRELASEKLSQSAVRHTLGQMTEDVLVKVNGETLAIADALGMPITPRAPFARAQQNIVNTAQAVRQSFAQLDHPLTLNDLQSYYYTTYFSMTPVAYFVTQTEDYAMLFQSLLSASGATAFLQFTPREIELLPVTDVNVQSNPMWMLGLNAVDALTKLVAAFADPEVSTPTTEALITKSRGVSAHDEGFGMLIEYVMGHVQSSVA